MGFKIIAPPAEMPVTMDDARTSARANGTEMDSEIVAQVAALTMKAEHIIGQPIINRTGRLTLDAFPETIVIPAAPVFAVSEITYFDVDGVEATLGTDVYALNDEGDIELAAGAEWPATEERSNAVTVTVLIGHGADSASVPAAFKGYILAKVREYFAPAGTPESPYVDRMLDCLKVYG